MEATVGFLQRKSRFYGWSRHVFVLDPQGLAQLLPEKQPHASAGKTAGRTASSRVIGDAGAIDTTAVYCQRRKRLAALHDIVGASGRSTRELVLTLPSRSIVLRASSPEDRNLWLGAIKDAVFAAATAADDGAMPSLAGTRSATPASAAPALPAAATLAGTPVPMVLTLVDNDLASGAGVASPSGELGSPSDSDNIAGWLPSLASLADGMAAEPPGDRLDAGRDGASSPMPNPAATCAATDALPSAAASILGLADADCLRGGRLLGDFDFATHTENFDVDRIFDGDSDDDDDCVLGMRARSRPLPDQPRKGAQHSSGGTRSSPTCMPLADAAVFQADHIATVPDTLDADAIRFGDIFGSFLDTLTSGPEPLPSANSSLAVSSAPCLASASANDVPAADDDACSARPVVHVEDAAALPPAADIAATLLDSMGLPDCLFGSPPEASLVAPKLDSGGDEDGDSDGSNTDNKPLCHLVGAAGSGSADPPPAKPAAPKLDPPGQFGLGGRSLSKLKSLVGAGGPGAAPRVGRPDEPPGLQKSLLSKYSESLSTSRTALSSVGRAGKPRTMLGWQTNVSKANGLRGMDRTAEIVQYKPKEPTETGISKVVRSTLGAEAAGGDTERKQAVRRVRQTRSESKVVPLKSIRLRLDGSIAGARAAAAWPQGASAQAPRYTVKGGRIEGIASPPDLGAARNPVPVSGQHGAAGAGGQGAGDALGEYGEIQRRLKLAEEQKRQQQRQQLMDKDGVDGVRIADIIKSRQDTPLAVQLEERRRMQQAKQLAIMNQQLEMQRMEAEARRLHDEQQQQHEQYRLRSLHPGGPRNRRHSMASAGCSVGHTDWPGCSASIGEPHMAEWPPAHNAYGGTVHSTNSAAAAAMWQQHHRLHRQQAVYSSLYSGHPSRATTPGIHYESGGPWPHPLPAGGHPPSQLSHTMAPSFQFTDASSHYAPATARGQPGSAFARQPRSVSRAAQTEHSGGSPGSWQGQGQPANYRYGESMAASSPALNHPGARRSSSLGYAGARQPIAGQPHWAPRTEGAVPPVPPLPRTPTGAHPHHGRLGPPAPGPPAYGHWARPMPGGPDVQRVRQKWAAMAAHTPSLLQQLHQAQTTGMLPMQRVEKELYAKGAYQNASVPTPVRGGTGVHHLGNGDTLLIDHVHESQRTRRALIKKLGTYTSSGAANAAPTSPYCI